MKANESAGAGSAGSVPGPGVVPGTVRIFDTTLRDGEQAPGAGFTVAEKIEVARQLVRLRVDVIEAGFPASSPGEFEAVQAIARETRGVAVAALARCKDGDPQRAVEAIRVAERPHLHVFIASSDIHLKHKLRITRDEALLAASKWVAYGRKALGPDAEVEFSAEDATRTDLDFLMKLYEVAVDAGASTLNIPDTVGYAIPAEFGGLVNQVVGRFGSAATVSVHCHNDLGLATSNTLAALQNGARQLEVCVNGLGERAGNASLEEVVMGIKTRPTQFPNLVTRVVTEQITPASRLVSYLTGFAVQPNKAVVGANAFAHESGIHQDGVIKNPLTYEIMTPQSVGLSGSQLTIGDQSRSLEATGNGPVDALYGAIDQALESVLGWKPILEGYEIKAVSAGEDAQGQVIARVRRSTDEGPEAFVATGHGLSTNIIEASVAAYLSGAEKLQQDSVARAALLEAARASGQTPEKVEKLP